MSKEENYGKAIFLVILAYLLAGVAAYALAYFLPDKHPLFIIGAADIAATLVIFIFSLSFNNTSFYDPYWSIVPPVIAGYLIYIAAAEANDIRQYLVAAVVGLWAIRLTFNWLRRWEGLGDEDFRYKDMRRFGKVGYWIVSLTGLQLFPTVLVFLGCLPLYAALSLENQAFNVLDILATVIGLGAVLIQLISDNQLWAFIQSKPAKGTFISSGLWAYSRHPNYFGEICFWLSLYLFGLAALPNEYWWTGIGLLGMIILFVFASVPMMEKRMVEKRPTYVEQQKKVSVLIPWFPKK